MTVTHALKEAADCLGVVIRQEGSGQPQAERPSRRQTRATGHKGVAVEDLRLPLAELA